MTDSLNDAFKALAFDRLGEADVREEVLAPMIRLLGYRSGTEDDVVREQSLRYPMAFIGRKNPHRDVPIRGKADYILEVKGHARWVLEAKAPGVEINEDAIEQAYSYANHPEVRAVYFGLCNGHVFKLFRTSAAPSDGSFLEVSYSDLVVRWRDISDILGVVAIRRDFPASIPAGEVPIAPGLRSFVRISSGTVSYMASSVPHPMMSQMQFSIVGGSIERSEGGKLIAYFKSQAPLRVLQRLNEMLQVDDIEMLSEDEVLSIDPANPTVFSARQIVILPKGIELFDVLNWKSEILPMTIHCEVSSRAEGFYKDGVFSGRFFSETRTLENLGASYAMGGVFSVRLG